MSTARGFGVYRVIKVRMDLVQDGSIDKLLLYSLLDAGSIRIFHGRMAGEDENNLPHGVKTAWRDFCSFVDYDRIPFPLDEGEAQPQSPASPPEEEQVSTSEEQEGDPSIDYQEQVMAPIPKEILLLQELRRVLDECGIYDIREENLSKLRHLEESFARVGETLYSQRAVAFLKVEPLSSLDAEDLLKQFPEESAKEDFWANRKSEDTGKSRSKVPPKAVFPCFAVVSPIGGIPASDLAPGDTVSLAVPQDSLLYSIVKYQKGGAFSGEMDIVLSSVKPAGNERVALEFVLSSELEVVAVVQSNLRIRAVKGSRPISPRPMEISPAMKQGFIVTAVALVALILILLLFVR